MTDLYDYFGVKNREELLGKMKDDDPIVKSLVDFYNNYESKTIKQKGFTTPYAYSDYIKNNNLVPEKDELIITVLNTRLNPLNTIKIKVDTPIKEYFSDLYSGTMTQYMIGSGANVAGEDVRLKSKEIDEIGLNRIDSFKFSDNTVYDSQAGRVGNYHDNNLDKSVRIKSEVTNHEIKELTNYNEFSKYYGHQELIGTNIFDKEKIENNLKIAYENLSHEEATLIQYDSDFKITNIIDVTAGTANSSILDMPRIAKIINESERGILFVHGHPSQSTSFSEADIQSMDRLADISKSLGKVISESFLVAGNKVVKMSESDPYTKIYDLNKQEKENYLIHRLNYDKSDFKEEDKYDYHKIEKIFIEEKKSYSKIYMTINNSNLEKAQDIIYVTSDNPVDVIKNWQDNKVSYKDLIDDNILSQVAFQDIDRKINATKISDNIKEKMDNPENIIEDFEKQNLDKAHTQSSPAR